MSGYNSSSKEVSVASEYNHGRDDEGQALRPSSEQMVHSKVEANHPDQVRDPEYAGMTLKQEEEARARELEIERTRWARSNDDREQRTREMVTEELGGLRDPETADWLRDVNPAIESELRKHAKRIADQVDRGWGTPYLMQELAKEIRLGDDWSAAVLRVLERAKTAPGVYVEPGMVEKVDRKTCHVTGEVVQLWDPGHPKIEQVGLLAGEDGSTVKFTAWTKSRCNEVEEGDQVVMKDVVRNWYQGRVSIALTWDSHVTFLNDEEEWDGS